MFVSPASNVYSENNELKIEVASENIDRGKSIIVAPLSLKRKRLETLGLRRLITKSLNRWSRISVITVEFQGILVQIATSDLPLNKAIVCSRPEIKISFHPLTYLGDLLKALMFLLNLNNFNSSPSPPDQRFAQRKGSSKVWKEKGLKWFSHFFFLSHYVYALLVCFTFLFLSQSSFMNYFV